MIEVHTNMDLVRQVPRGWPRGSSCAIRDMPWGILSLITKGPEARLCNDASSADVTNTSVNTHGLGCATSMLQSYFLSKHTSLCSTSEVLCTSASIVYHLNSFVVTVSVKAITGAGATKAKTH